MRCTLSAIYKLTFYVTKTWASFMARMSSLKIRKWNRKRVSINKRWRRSCETEQYGFGARFKVGYGEKKINTDARLQNRSVWVKQRTQKLFSQFFNRVSGHELSLQCKRQEEPAKCATRAKLRVNQSRMKQQSPLRAFSAFDAGMENIGSLFHQTDIKSLQDFDII